MTVMVFAGASFPCGGAALGSVARRHGFDPLFLEHNRNADEVPCALSPVGYSERIGQDLARQEGYFVPLLESWVTAGMRMPSGSHLNFDRKAARASRSKLALSQILIRHGLPAIPRRTVECVDGALRHGSDVGYPMIVRPDSGYSGRGVRIVDSPAGVASCWRSLESERGSAAYREMTRMMGRRHDAVLVEPWLPGDEWSLDCIVSPTGTRVIRVCEKAIVVVDGRPVTGGYRISDDEDLCAEAAAAARAWTRALFRGDTISYACFDFRRDPKGCLIPLDFGARLGNHGVPLLVQKVSTNGNPYAIALDSALRGGAGSSAALVGGHALVHAFATRPGVFQALRVRHAAEVIDHKPWGYRIEDSPLGSLFRRVASVLTCFESRAEFLDACCRAPEWLEPVIGNAVDQVEIDKTEPKTECSGLKRPRRKQPGNPLATGKVKSNGRRANLRQAVKTEWR